jgi:hypothetical protein
MAKRSKKKVPGSEVMAEAAPRSLTIAAEGIETAQQFAQLMSGLMSDLIEGKVSPQVGNATCNAGGKLLKVVELQYKYGDPGGDRPGGKSLRLT